jgi:hypothetical protein
MAHPIQNHTLLAGVGRNKGTALRARGVEGVPSCSRGTIFACVCGEAGRDGVPVKIAQPTLTGGGGPLFVTGLDHPGGAVFDLYPYAQFIGKERSPGTPENAHDPLRVNTAEYEAGTYLWLNADGTAGRDVPEGEDAFYVPVGLVLHSDAWNGEWIFAPNALTHARQVDTTYHGVNRGETRILSWAKGSPTPKAPKGQTWVMTKFPAAKTDEVLYASVTRTV